MSARCEPPEQFRWKEGRHWLRLGTDDDYLDTVAFWGQQHWTWGGRQRDPEEVHKSGWRYLAPVATPAEVETLRAEVPQARSYLARLLQNTHPQCEPLPDLWGLCTQIDNMVTEIPKLRAEVERLRGALEWTHAALVVQHRTALDSQKILAVTIKNERRSLLDIVTAARMALTQEPGDEG